MGDVGEQRPQRHHQLDAQLLCTVAVKPFQCRFGSAPDRNTTSRPAPSGAALSITSSGHSISRVRPSLIRTVGRVTWKS
jgi:hypothetical protein